MDDHTDNTDNTAELIERLRRWLFEDDPAHQIDASPSLATETPTTVVIRDAPAAGLDRGG